MSARMFLRLSKTEKALIKEAAALRGQTLSSFAVDTLVNKAQAILDEHRNVTVLTERDAEEFLAILDSHKGPNAALRRAMRRYEERYKKVGD